MDFQELIEYVEKRKPLPEDSGRSSSMTLSRGSPSNLAGKDFFLFLTIVLYILYILICQFVLSSKKKSYLIYFCLKQLMTQRKLRLNLGPVRSTFKIWISIAFKLKLYYKFSIKWRPAKITQKMSTSNPKSFTLTQILFFF